MNSVMGLIRDEEGGSLIGQVPQTPAEYLEDLSDAQQHGDDGEGVHGAEEDGLLKVFGHHALGDVEGVRQGAGVAHEERLHQEAEKVALQPEGEDLQDDPQEDRDDVEDGVDGPLEDLLLVSVLARRVEVEDRPRD